MASPEPSPGPPHTEAEWRALAAIAQGKRAWSRTADLVAAGVEPATLEGLVRRGLAVWWRPRRRADAEGWALCVALTPWGTAVARREVAERWEVVRPPEEAAETGERPGGGLMEVPYYGLPEPPKELRIRPRKLRLSRWRNERAIPAPQDVVSESMGPEEEAILREEAEQYLMATRYEVTTRVDAATGEEVAESVEVTAPVEILGVKVRRDYRIRTPKRGGGR
jgi:hypothetical protein